MFRKYIMSDPFKNTELPNKIRVTKAQMIGMSNGDDKFVVTIGGKKYPILRLNDSKNAYNQISKKQRKEVQDGNLENYKAFLRKQGLAPNVFSKLDTYTKRDVLQNDIKSAPLYKKSLRGADPVPAAAPAPAAAAAPAAAPAPSELPELIEALMKPKEAQKPPGSPLVKTIQKKIKQRKQEKAEEKEEERDKLKDLRDLVTKEINQIGAQKQKDISIKKQKQLKALKSFQQVIKSLSVRKKTAETVKQTKNIEMRLQRLLTSETRPKVAETVPETVPESQIVNEEEVKLEAGEAFDPTKVQTTEQDGKVVYGQAGAMALRVEELAEEDEVKDEEEDDKLKSDNVPDISQYGHQNSVSLVCVANGRDFTYYKTLIANNVAIAPSGDLKTRTRESKIMEMEYAPIIGWNGFKSNYDLAECIELYAIVMVFKEVLAEERQWKRAIVKLQRMSADRESPSEVGGGDLGVVMPLDAFGIRPQDLLNAAEANRGEEKEADDDDGDEGEEKQEEKQQEGKEQEEPKAAPQPPKQAPPQGMFRTQNQKIKGSSEMQNKKKKKKKKQPLSLNPGGLLFNTGTRFNPNLLMSLGKNGYNNAIEAVDDNQFSYNRVMEPPKPSAMTMSFNTK